MFAELETIHDGSGQEVAGAGAGARRPSATDAREVWLQKHDADSGEFYFVNSVTGVSTWDRPSDGALVIDA